MITKIVIISLVCLVIGVGSTAVIKLKPDNPIEEAAEEVIEEHTGLDIDLSPDSPEEPKEG